MAELGLSEQAEQLHAELLVQMSLSWSLSWQGLVVTFIGSEADLIWAKSCISFNSDIKEGEKTIASNK